MKRTTLSLMSASALLLAACAPDALPDPVEEIGNEVDYTAETVEDAVVDAEQEVRDSMMAHSVSIALLDDLGTDGLRVAVEVEDSHVRLYGTVEHRASQRLASEIVAGLPDVAGVDNDIQWEDAEAVLDAAGAAEADADLEKRVGAVIMDHVDADPYVVSVHAADGVVLLTGVIDDVESRRAAVDAVEAMDGVDRVIDHMVVFVG